MTHTNNPSIMWNELYRFKYRNEHMCIEAEWPADTDTKYRICLLKESMDGEPLSVTTLLTTTLDDNPISLANWITKSLAELDRSLTSLMLQVS